MISIQQEAGMERKWIAAGIVFIFCLVSYSWASLPVKVTIIGCVKDGKFISEQTDFGTHVSEGKYTIRPTDSDHRLIDMGFHEGRRIRVPGYLLPGDRFIIELEDIEDLGSCPKSSQMRPQTIDISPVKKGEVIFNNGNISRVYNSPTHMTTFSIDRPHHITMIQNYHWNNGRGATPGTISLRNEEGEVFGPWWTTGRYGQGGVPDAYWECYPEVIIPPGRYTVIDSDPGTWAQNAGSQGTGMARIEGFR
jgi:hypothetical protein